MGDDLREEAGKVRDESRDVMRLRVRTSEPLVRKGKLFARNKMESHKLSTNVYNPVGRE
jgi:hypothetical protein